MIDQIQKALIELRQRKPLILCLTNSVTQDFVANSLLALGAAPIMSACEGEIEELVRIASALYVNIGTLDDKFIALAQKAIKLGRQHNQPIVLDPVGAGATHIRTKTAQGFLALSNIIRGNASEIIALGSEGFSTYGVEATHPTDDAESIATRLAIEHNATVIVSGPVDFITNGDQSARVPFGTPLMGLVTGMGCAMTAVVAAFESIIADSFEGSSVAAHYFALCGEVTSQNYSAPGSFKAGFLDQLHSPDWQSICKIFNKK
jgi:hydroxyethylthiazole kinase